MEKRTKIIATIGPATGTVEILQKVLLAGVDVCRLNFSHGTYDDHAYYIKNIRQAAQLIGRPVAILQDLQGPKIRVGEMPKDGMILKDDQEVILSEHDQLTDVIHLPLQNLSHLVQIGQRFLIDDGLLEVRIIKIDGNAVHAIVVHGGTLLSHKGVNFPDTRLPIPAITDKDKQDLAFGVAQGVDWIALSFVRSAEDVKELKHLIWEQEEEQGLPHEPTIKIAAKMEKPEAIENMQSIITEAEAILVARGDLAIELAYEKVPMAQRRLIDAARRQAKPVFVATQMLDSMIRNPRPTRAEVSDIANAVMDQADGTMLSGETTTGKYPLECVEMMVATIKETEADHKLAGEDKACPHEDESIGTIIHAVHDVARDSKAKVILITADDEAIRRNVIASRPHLPMLVAYSNERACRQAVLHWGVRPVLITETEMTDKIEALTKIAQQFGLVETGDELIVVAVSTGPHPMTLIEVRSC